MIERISSLTSPSFTDEEGVRTVFSSYHHRHHHPHHFGRQTVEKDKEKMRRERWGKQWGKEYQRDLDWVVWGWAGTANLRPYSRSFLQAFIHSLSPSLTFSFSIDSNILVFLVVFPIFCSLLLNSMWLTIRSFMVTNSENAKWPSVNNYIQHKVKVGERYLNLCPTLRGCNFIVQIDTA